jgi:cytochrome b6-f complex iron-sulfur subunit
VLIKKTPVGDLLLVRSGENQYSAFSIICPHLKCNVKVKSPTLIQCPCHQSGYTIQGDYISGPAKKGLNKFPVSVEEGVIKILKA